MFLDQKNNFYLISVSFSLAVCWVLFGYYREKLYVNNFWKFKSLQHTVGREKEVTYHAQRMLS